MLPLYERTVRVSRKNVAPVWTRSFPVSKQPQTIREHLKKQRFSARLRQSQAAQQLGVSNRTLSLWECYRIVPAAPFHERIAAYLGYDPFNEAGK
jgi:DNA-binding XRE family transcriptional regulator